jgi:hypothetical protein
MCSRVCLCVYLRACIYDVCVCEGGEGEVHVCMRAKGEVVKLISVCV